MATADLSFIDTPLRFVVRLGKEEQIVFIVVAP